MRLKKIIDKAYQEDATPAEIGKALGVLGALHDVAYLRRRGVPLKVVLRYLRMSRLDLGKRLNKDKELRTLRWNDGYSVIGVNAVIQALKIKEA